MEVSRFTNWGKVKFEVTGTDDFSLWGMDHHTQRVWDGVGGAEKADLELFEGQFGVVIDFVKAGIPEQAVLF